MNRALELQLLSELISRCERGSEQEGGPDSLVPVAQYTSAAWLAAEVQALFRPLPLVVGHTSELLAPGDFLTHDESGVPLLLVRTDDGSVRGFLNVCRHRGTRLVTERRGNAKVFVCRYHAWSYTQTGSLLRVPQRQCFPSLRDEDAGLVEVPVKSRCGFLWAVPGGRGRELDLDSYLGAIAGDLDDFGLSQHVVHREVRDRKRANWKLVMDAFLEGYHVRSLHRDTISRFFLDSLLLAQFPPHSRAIGARRTLQEARTLPPERWELRAMTTPFYLLFPSTILVFHPDWVTALTLFPDGTDHLLYHHRMLIPRPPENEEQSRYWDKTFQLIEGSVFQREDLAIAESIQSGLGAKADTHFRLGHLEVAVKWFHDELARRVEPALSPNP